jgi:hypothetical protein
MKKYSKERFVEVVGNVDWSHVLNCVDVDQAWYLFKDMFLSALNSLAPIETNVNQTAVRKIYHFQGHKEKGLLPGQIQKDKSTTRF